MSKAIKNIVIYKSLVNGQEIVKSCIFYTDGSVKEGTYEDGIEACKVVAKERNITSKNALKEMMNKEIFHVMSEKEFIERYDSFKPEISEKLIDELVKESFEEKEDESVNPFVISSFKPEEDKEVVTNENPFVMKEVQYEPVEEVKEEKPELEINNEEVVYSEDYNGDYYHDFSDSYDEEIEDEDLEEEVVEEDNFINRSGAKLKKDNLGVKIVAVALGLTIGAVLFSHCHRKSKEGEMTNANLPTPTPITTTVEDDIYGPVQPITNIEYNNDLYNDYTFSQLLDVTTNEFQRNSMINLSASLNGFNGSFAENYLESGNDIRAALTFDEVVALQQAYNSYSIDEIRAYFNGYEVNAEDMSNAYKAASLQLMGAYVIETSENPVDMSILIDSQEGRDFYARYHTMFLAAKEATGAEQLELVNQFYQAVREDFPITEEVRTDGIAHSGDYNSLEDYQLAVAPMIAAAEIMFQNLEVDYTLDTIENNISEIDFINDIGLCNVAYEKFERIETIMLSAYEDNENPLFEQYRNAIIADLVDRNEYVIDDEHRELANLRRFQEVVNGDNYYLGMYSTTYTGVYGGGYTTSTSSSTTTTTTGETSTTTTWTETTVTEGTIPPEEQAAIDAQIAQENAAAQAAAEQAAAQEAARQQEIENQNAQNVENQVQQENQQTQNDINDINNTINNGGTVNENNYPNIDFDDPYTDNNGNLDNSVQNVTTDGTGADQPLPDPNVTGAQFDAASAQISYNNVYIVEDANGASYTEWVDVTEGGAYTEYEDGYVPFDENGNPIVIDEGGYQYVR
jgi:hypothetical protein